ncbi:MAG: TerC family protein [Chloroflexota bacterium]|nr:TerC family protein [Chloroflexota bacterium]
MSSDVMVWIGFNVVVLVLLILDLKVFHRKSHVIGVKESLWWTAFWIVLSLLFNLVIYFWRGPDTALQFLTGYLIEKSLSVDNLFVFLMIFSYFAVPAVYQHKALFWGILGAIVMRLIFILAGVALIERFHWVMYVFGVFLIFTAIRMAVQKDREIHPEKNPVLRLFGRLMPVTEGYEGDKFFIKRAGRYLATPLLVVVLVIETTDVIFALDSVPAVLGITLDPFIVYSSNICAILGLRALYFALAGIMQMFRYLNYGLVAVLAFIGIKMLISGFYEIPVGIALGVVGGVLLLSVALSIISARVGSNEVLVSPDPVAGETSSDPVQNYSQDPES